MSRSRRPFGTVARGGQLPPCALIGKAAKFVRMRGLVFMIMEASCNVEALIGESAKVLISGDYDFLNKSEKNKSV